MKVKRSLLVMALILALVCLPGMAMASVLTFDDLSPSTFAPGGLATDINTLVSNYAGFSWYDGSTGYWGVVPHVSYAQSPYNNASPFTSGDNVVTNEDGNTGAPAVFMASTPFNYQGAYFAPWSQNDATAAPVSYYGASALTIKGYLGGTLVGTQSFNLAAGPLTWVAGSLNNTFSIQ